LGFISPILTCSGLKDFVVVVVVVAVVSLCQHLRRTPKENLNTNIQNSYYQVLKKDHIKTTTEQKNKKRKKISYKDKC
jgi:predicted nucleic-acid-binding protein